MNYQEANQSQLLQDAFPDMAKDSLKTMVWQIFWGLLIDTVLVVGCGAALILNFIRSIKMLVKRR